MFLRDKAFSLVELLVVIAIIALLLGILIPALGAARSQCKAVVCKSNLSQLVLANTGYATGNNGFYVPAASDMDLDIGFYHGGFHRWHGVRASWNKPFDPLKGPLVKYLADGKVKECPAKIDFMKNQTSFEKGCGGYGYNMTYIGSRVWSDGYYTRGTYETTAKDCGIRQPAHTLMFADTAFYSDDQHLIEYSFTEPPLIVYNGNPMTGFYSLPSLHFRHRNRANVGWVDGHISSETMTDFNVVIYDGINSSDVMLGWFGPLDNGLFDLK